MRLSFKAARTALLACSFAMAAIIVPSMLLAQDDPAPEKPAQDQSQTQTDRSEDGIEKSIESLEQATDRQIKEAKKAARDALERIKAAYADIKEKAAKELEERRPEYERRMADAEKKLDELTTAAGEKWEQAKKAVADSLRDMSRWVESYGTENADETPSEEPKRI